MSLPKKFVLSGALWLSLITFLHLWLNLGFFRARPEFRIGFLPVTCHLTCPVAHFINENMSGDGLFEPVRFNGWAELKEAFISGKLQATFILAPMAMALREEGVPIKIVYLGHRDGTAMMVHKDSTIHSIADLRGKTIAVPNRFSNQSLIIYRALKKHGMSVEDVNIREMPPPDMPVTLSVRAVDAVISGEPFMGQTELGGYGKILFLTKDVWPDFISCVLAVSEKTIQTNRPAVQRLVDGIARSGKWLDVNMDHRMQAATIASRERYFNQNSDLLKFVLSKPPDRVKYTNLNLHRKDFEEIEALGKEAGILKGTARFEDYADPSFVRDESLVLPYTWESP